jgi:peptidoglycan/LPS O-acetylase OafA/YrhL
MSTIWADRRRAEHNSSVAVSPNSDAPATLAARRFRPDIQGLRAVAVLLVVLYHADVPGVWGGYVGVDVFFVISGYLITGQLVAEAVKAGRISLTQFYLKRVRRLLPSAVVVIVVTLLVARVFAPPLFSLSLSVDGIFAGLYVLNYRLAAEGINYQNAGAAPSAFQHFWSLGVEEQFYVFWPLLIITAMVLTRRWWRDLLPALFLTVIAVSLYISEFLLASDAPMSYFSVQSRAWEFGVGALLSLASGLLARLRPAVRGLLLCAGLGLIVFTGVFYNAATQFPGVHAVAPVAATTLVIAAGCGTPLRAEALLGNRLMQWLGQMSYPWYLWHWPVLILAPYIWPRLTFSWPANLGLCAFSLALAAATYYGLEIPLRRPKFRRAVWATAGVALMAVVVTVGAVIDSNISTMFAATTPHIAAAPVASAKSQFGIGPIANPFASKLASGPVSPSILKAVSDTPAYPADCIVPYGATTSPTCLIGTDGALTNSPVTSNRVVLLGDSHAGEWYPDVFGVAHVFGWDTEVLNKEGCPLASITVENAASDGPFSECNQWRTNMFQRLLGEPRPKIIFIASLNYYTADTSYLATGWKETIQALKAIGAPIVYLHDTPYPNYDVPTCVSGALSDWAKCSFSRAVAFHTDPLMSGTAASHGLAARVNVDQYLCPTAQARCPAVLAGTLLYRDNSHVTNTAMSMLEPLVDRQLGPLLEKIKTKAQS